MKKIISIILAAVMLTAALTLTACTGKETAPEQIRVLTLMGPTGMGMAKLINDSKNTENAVKYEFTVATAPDQVSAQVIKGDFEIAAVPVNLAAVLYNKTEGAVQVAGVNTLGVLYMLETGDTVKSVADLKGKTIYATGQGANPEYTLRYILAKNNIDPDKDVTIEFLSEHAELAAKMVSGDVTLGMLPEPNVTSVLLNNKDAHIALDLNKEWKNVSGADMVMGCIIVNSKFAEEHKDNLDAFLAEYAQSIDFVNSNVDEAARLCEHFEIIPKAPVAKKAIPNSGIVYLDGEEMKEALGAFLTVLNEYNPKIIGGTLPDEGFYYSK